MFTLPNNYLSILTIVVVFFIFLRRIMHSNFFVTIHALLASV